MSCPQTSCPQHKSKKNIPSGQTPQNPQIPQNPQQNPQPQPQQPKSIPQEPKAVCPRCGTTYKINKPVRSCQECGLLLGELDSYGEMDWNDLMKEPFPDFVSAPTLPDKIFARTIRWYYEKWVKPFEANPSHRIGKIDKKKEKPNP